MLAHVVLNIGLLFSWLRGEEKCLGNQDELQVLASLGVFIWSLDDLTHQGNGEIHVLLVKIKPHHGPA